MNLFAKNTINKALTMILAANVMSRSQNEGFKVTEKRAARWLSIYSCGQFPTPLSELSGVSVVTRGSHVTTCPVHCGKLSGDTY